MKFLRLPLIEASGCVLAHNLIDSRGCRILKKGAVLTDRDVCHIAEFGREFIYVAKLEHGDVGEDEAARRVAAAVAGPGVFSPRAASGRANLKAATAGLLRVNVEAVDRLNQIDDGITVATLATHSFVRAAQMVATVKIIPFAVADKAVKAAEEYSLSAAPIISVQALPARKVGLLVTAHQSQHRRIAAEFAPALQARLERLGSSIAQSDFAEHEVDDIAQAIRQQLAAQCEMILIVSTTAIIDRRDVVPLAIEQAGGAVEHFGVPVDPGNLLLLGYFATTPIIGVPGCARSAKTNAFDLVLPRLLAGERFSRRDLIRFGHGGLLEEIRERHLLRESIDKTKSNAC
jgi:molybdenum cofactor cytidylyltransferase